LGHCQAGNGQTDQQGPREKALKAADEVHQVYCLAEVTDLYYLFEGVHHEEVSLAPVHGQA
jgi:hypothetical protein